MNENWVSLSMDSDDNSSLDVLDLNLMPDARKSVSFVHVSNKTSSVDSWLDHCFSVNGEDKSSEVDIFSNDGQKPSIPELPCSPNTFEPALDSIDNNSQCAFDFNPEELDLDILINEEEDEEEQNNTITQADVKECFSNDIPKCFEENSEQFFQGEKMINDGKPPSNDVFNEWTNDKIVDFSGFESQNQILCGNEQFASAGDAENIFNKEEEHFEKENLFKLNENFEILKEEEEETNPEFSVYRTSNFFDMDKEGGKVSIGTYIASRSEKLGKFDKDSFVERPSFGLQVVTPSHQKEVNVVNSVNNSLADAKNESVNQSLMYTLSKALSNMSTSLTSHEVAQFLIELSKKKQISSESGNFKDTDDSISEYIQVQDHTSFQKCVPDNKDFSKIKSPSELSFIQSPIENTASSSTLTSKTSDCSRLESTNSLHGSPTARFQSISSSSDASLNNHTLTNSDDDITFSPCSENSFFPNVLSSTKDNLSLRGLSMGRESIAKYHQNLRAHADEKELHSFISAPSELVFEKPLCIGVPSKGVLPLKNKSSSWVQIDLRCISISIDDKEPLFPNNNYISMKWNFRLSPYSNEANALYIMGLEPGKYNIILEVLNSSISSEQTSFSSTRCCSSLVQVYAVVHHPSVFVERELDCNMHKKQSINLGQVIYGSSKSLPIKLINKSKFSVPVSILLYMPSFKNSQFSLSLTLDNVHDQLKPVTKLQTVLSADEERLVVWIHFSSVSPMLSTEQFTADALDKVNGQLQIFLDAPFAFCKKKDSDSAAEKLLDTVELNCSVGFSKLHAPRNKQALTFFAQKGSSDVKKIPIRNVGNISVSVQFSFEDYSPIFKLDPKQATLPAGKEVLLTVAFTPDHKCAITSTNTPMTKIILMNILPIGPQFEVQIYGNILPPASNFLRQPKKASTCLLTNKTQLQWGGVPLGSSRKQKLMLRSINTRLPVQCLCSIAGVDSSCFQFVVNNHTHEELSWSKKVTVLPNQDQSICLVFTPNNRKMIHAKLELKTPIDNLPATKYTIPLAGYGGRSQIEIQNMPKTHLKTRAFFGDNRPTYYSTYLGGNSNKFIVMNHGCRSAFIKLIAYKDVNFTQIVTSVVLYPSQFVLKEKQSKDISLRINSPSEKPFFICILHGDELSRLLLKKALSLQSSLAVDRFIPACYSHIRSISFTEVFSGESCDAEENIDDVDVNLMTIQIFYLNLLCILIEVKHKEVLPTPSSESSGSNLSIFDIPVRDVGLDLDSEKTDSSVEKVSSSQPSHEWTLTPECISLNVFSPKANFDFPTPAHVKLKNHSRLTLFFDVVWPGHYLTVTPQHGLVEPDSTLLLSINANPSLSMAGSILPWQGQILILATGSEMSSNSRAISVQINKASTTTKAISKVDASINNCKIPPKPLTEKAKQNLEVVSDSLEFQDVDVGSCLRLKLEFQNTSVNSINWLLTSVAPAYVKSHSYKEAAGVYRCSYAPFLFSVKSGQLKSYEWARIEVTFSPVSVGLHSQQWELEYHDADDVDCLTLQRVKVHLSGNVNNPTSIASDSAVSKLHLPKPNVFVSKDCFWFPDTLISSTSLIKIPVNNRGKSSENVKFVLISPLFHISQQKYSLCPMRCANLPVTFKPTSPGYFTDVLIIESASNSITVTLKARCIEK